MKTALVGTNWGRVHIHTLKYLGHILEIIKSDAVDNIKQEIYTYKQARGMESSLDFLMNK